MSLLQVVVMLAAGALGAAACKPKAVPAEPDPAARARVLALRDAGEALFSGRAGCIACHKVGGRGEQVRGPNLGVGDGETQPIAARARLRRSGVPALVYVVESIVDPDAVLAPGYVAGVMKRPDEPPVSLTDQEILALAVYLCYETDPAAVQVAEEALKHLREAREARLAGARVEQALGAVPWDRADATRGASVFARLRCASCHDHRGEERHPKTPSLKGIGKRLDRDAIARRIYAHPEGGMPAYADQVSGGALGDLSLYVLSL